jgi:acyl-CoA dehydrogenase
MSSPTPAGSGIAMPEAYGGAGLGITEAAAMMHANAAKYLAAEAAVKCCQAAMLTHGGFGYAKEDHVERYLREALVLRIAPISPHLILSNIAGKVLGLPKSY